MKPTWSPHWDELCRRALNERRPELLKKGGEIEMAVMGLVLFPERIQSAWDDGEWESLAHLAEFIAAGIPRDLAKTDVVLHNNMVKGLAEIRRLGWPGRLNPAELRRLEDEVQLALADKRMQNPELTEQEILQVRQVSAAGRRASP